MHKTLPDPDKDANDKETVGMQNEKSAIQKAMAKNASDS